MAYFVYELVNEDRREIFVNIATQLDAELRRLRLECPPWLEGWSLADRQKPRILEVFPDKDEAHRFALEYVRRTPAPGWKTVPGRDIR